MDTVFVGHLRLYQFWIQDQGDTHTEGVELWHFYDSLMIDSHNLHTSLVIKERKQNTML